MNKHEMQEITLDVNGTAQRNRKTQILYTCCGFMFIAFLIAFLWYFGIEI